MTEQDIAGLEARLSRLERQNRRLRRLATAGLLLATGLLIAAAADDLAGQRIRPSAVDTNTLDVGRATIRTLEAGDIEADSIRVAGLNASGFSVGELRIGGAGRHALIDHEGIHLFDRSGTERLRLVIPEDVDSPLLEVLGEDGETRQVAVGYWDEDGNGFCGLSILDEAGQAVLEVALPAEIISDYQPGDASKSSHGRRVIIRR